MQRVLNLHEKDQTRDTIMTTIVTSELPLSQKLKVGTHILCLGPLGKLTHPVTGGCNERRGGSFVDEYCSLFVPIRNLFRHALVFACLLGAPSDTQGCLTKTQIYKYCPGSFLPALYSWPTYLLDCLASWHTVFRPDVSAPPDPEHETHTHTLLLQDYCHK